MVDLEIPNQGWSVRVLFFMGLCVSLCHGQPKTDSSRWQVNFPALPNGKTSESTAVWVNERSAAMVIVATGADATNATLKLGNQNVPVKMIGYDSVSRLGFIQASGGIAPETLDWSEAASKNENAALHAVEGGKSTTAQCAGWVKQVGGKILPFALLRVNFSQTVPPPGTPLFDNAERVVAVVFQSANSGNVGYAIPAEAVHRVKRDIFSGGLLNRGWLGIALRPESQTPKISRVLSGSPAEAAGVKQDDVLLSIGTRQIKEYADAANAFFYLIPGQSVDVKLRRGGEQLAFSLTPIKPL